MLFIRILQPNNFSTHDLIYLWVGGSGVSPLNPPYPLGTGRMKPSTLNCVNSWKLPPILGGGFTSPPPPPPRAYATSADPLPGTSHGPPRTSALNILASLFSDLFFNRFWMRFWTHLGSILGPKIAEKRMIFRLVFWIGVGAHLF